MEIPSFFMGKIIVTLFPFTDIPSGMKPSVAKSSVLTRHPGSALNSWKVPKMPCFCGFYGVGSNEPVDESSGFKRRGKIKLYQRRSYYAVQVDVTDFRCIHFFIIVSGAGFRLLRFSSAQPASCCIPRGSAPLPLCALLMMIRLPRPARE